MSNKYDIGYKKPPKYSQFKLGQSGNPKGRPKGSGDFIMALEDEMNQLVSIKVNGVTKKVSMRKVIAKRITKLAADGDLRAISLLFRYQQPNSETEDFYLIPEDKDALKKFEDSLLKRDLSDE